MNDLVTSLCRHRRRGNGIAAAENVNGLVVIGTNITPLTPVSIICVITAARAHNERGVPVILQGVGKNGLILAVDI